MNALELIPCFPLSKNYIDVIEPKSRRTWGIKQLWICYDSFEKVKLPFHQFTWHIMVQPNTPFLKLSVHDVFLLAFRFCRNRRLFFHNFAHF